MKKIPFFTFKNSKKCQPDEDGIKTPKPAPDDQNLPADEDIIGEGVGASNPVSYENINFNETFELFAKMAREIQVPTESLLAFLKNFRNDAAFRENFILNPLGICAKNIYSLAGDLSSIVNELRDTMDLYSNIISLKNERFDLLETLNTSVYHVISNYANDVYEFVPEVSPLLQRYFIGDETRLKHIIMNVLRNCLLDSSQIKVEMRVWQEPAKTKGDAILCLSVRRVMVGGFSGIMGSVKMEQFRLYGGANLDSAFLGPHMAYAKLMVLLLDGELTEIDEGVGNGFVVKIPLEKGFEFIIGEELASYLNAFSIKKGAKAGKKEFTDKKALIVDDSKTSVEATRGLLTSLGLKAEAKDGAKAAIDELLSNEYDVIFMDYLMPEINGIEAVSQIRQGAAGEAAKSCPIILLTGNEASEIIKTEGDGLKLVELCLSKPLQREEMENALRVIFNREDEEAEVKPQEASNADGDILVYSRLLDYGLDITKHEEMAKTQPAANAQEAVKECPDGSDEARADYIPGIDISDGLEKVDNNMEIYLIILGAFCEDIVTWLEVFGDYPETSSMDDVAIAVHGLKSAANGIGAIELGKRSLYLEHAAKGGNAEYLGLLLGDLCTDIKKMSDDVKRFVELNS